MQPVILVPIRSDGGHRDRLWAHCRAFWEENRPDWPIYEGASPEGLFNRSAAINDAARQADQTGGWDVAFITDGDTLSDPAAVSLGMRLAYDMDVMVNCHDVRVMVNRRTTDEILAGDRQIGPVLRTRRHADRHWYESPSSGVVVTRGLFDRVGGFDEEFRGWGHEDSAFRHACETMSGRPMVRVAVDCWHLWHEESPEASPRTATRRANMRRLAAYEEAAGDIAAIDRLTGGPR